MTKRKICDNDINCKNTNCRRRHPKRHIQQVEKNLKKRILLIFDLNGTLTCLSKTRYLKGISIRPGIEHLNRLFSSKKFQIGIWSSATKYNVEKMKEIIEENLNYKFHYVLDRRNTIPAPTKDNQYATKKPLAKNFPENNIERIILIDDTFEKSLDEEKRNLLLIPSWNEGDDSVLKKLVDSLLEIKLKGDVRDFIKIIRRKID